MIFIEGQSIRKAAQWSISPLRSFSWQPGSFHATCDTLLHACAGRFAFIFLTLVVVAGWTSITKCKVASLLNRQQTEEWKGWMQVG